MSSLESDRESIRRILRVRDGLEPWSHEVEALQADLFTRSRNRLLGYCTRIMKDPGKGEDMAQVATEIAWRRLADFRGESSFESFLFGIATKVCFRGLRERVEVLLDDPEVLEVASDHRSPLGMITREERKAMVRYVTLGLTELEQQVVYLRFYENLPYEAIERVLEIDLTVRKSGARGLLVACKRHLSARVEQWLKDNKHGPSFLEPE